MAGDETTDLWPAVGRDDLLTGCITGALPAGYRGHIDTDQAEFEEVDLGGATLGGCELRNLVMRGGSAARCRIERSRLFAVRFEGVDLTGLEFRPGSKLERVSFIDCKLAFVNSYDVVFDGVKFSGCQMRESRFNTITMKAVSMHRCDLTGSSFDRIEAAKPGDLDIRACTIDDTSGLGLTRNLRVDAAQGLMIADALLKSNGIDIGPDLADDHDRPVEDPH